MNAKPVTRNRQPAYPTRLEIQAHPNLLAEHQPPNWRNISGMAGAVSLFLAANTALNAADQRSAPAAAIVAPIFEHGDGRGATGCVAVSPPVFLSEEEALQVITEELAKVNVKLASTNVRVPELTIPRVTESYENHNGTWDARIKEEPKLGKELHLTGVDTAHKIAVEFVSNKNYYDVGGARSGSSVQVYDFKAVATALAQRIQTGAKIQDRVGVFYDPAARPDLRNRPTLKTNEDWREWYQDVRARGVVESQRLLRQQVKDFADWLKAQGAM